ncbi:MAG: VCBS repeat-containing protein [Eudoraea sp.]|nr:VCBS repeat-containing protein [Eudoraea sp.]NNJ41164.1 VCBS repeat-containing protein [Eudoraea sp.]
MLIFSCQQDKNEANIKDGDSALNETTQPVFKQVNSAHSQLYFENAITEDLSTLENLFNFDYFYNGSGVGIADLNNDGLEDIVFGGNQVNNRIFINQGDLVFQDITEDSGINKGKQWTNGITFVDINQDNWMDIYFSQGGPNQRLQRKNLLFINQRDGTFTEEAEAYGIADMGISTQSAFFDYDNDGDLDCIVMNENELYGVDPITLYQMIEGNEEYVRFNSSRLYRNDGGKFTDVTRAAGIERPIFGLGLMVSDLNTDGLLDIYLASDYYIPDALFINNGDGTFSDRIKDFTQQISFYGMGIDVADVDNNGLQDIFVLDMASSDHFRSKTLMASMNTDRFNYLVNTAGYHHQYMFNSLHLNIGNDLYNNIAQLTKMANTDWSWSVLMNDFDLDGDKDVYVTNGYRRYALDNDLQQQVFEARQRYGNQVPLEVKTQLYNAMPSEKLSNIMYRNDGQLSFKNVAAQWGLGEPSFSNGAALGDLDNDGDLDVVVNNMDNNAFLYQNLSVDEGLGNYIKVNLEADHSEPFARVFLKNNGQTQMVETKRVRGYMSAHSPFAHFGIGEDKQVDTVRVEWPDGRFEEQYAVAANTALVFNKKNAKSKRKTAESDRLFAQQSPEALNLDFTHRENEYDDFYKEVLLPYKQSTLGPCIAKADVNGDNKEDVFIGGAAGQAGQLFIQGNGSFSKMSPRAFTDDSGYEDMEAAFFDLDGDKDLDLYVVSGGNEFEPYSSFYEDRVYINDGSGNFSRKEIPALVGYAESGKAVVSLDFDQDGDTDLIVGNRIIPKNYPKHAPSSIYRNDEGSLVNATEEIGPGFMDFGIVNDLLVTDFNNDGWEDIIAVGEWSSLGFFKNNEGVFQRVNEEAGIPDDKGWWLSVTETDVNGDGKPDYILGNAGLNLKFKASREKPFKVYATDFDDNGTNDIVLSKKYQGEYVPVRGRECSSQQMPFIADKYKSYKEFASATLIDVYGEKLEESYAKEVTEFRSVLLLNKGDMQFEKIPLPVDAQQIPVMTVAKVDVNQDGYEDLILGGNIYETEVETPRLDAVSGVTLISDTQQGYYTLPQTETGLYIRGNVKDMQIIEVDQKKLLWVGRNNEKSLLYQIN